MNGGSYRQAMTMISFVLVRRADAVSCTSEFALGRLAILRAMRGACAWQLVLFVGRRRRG